MKLCYLAVFRDKSFLFSMVYYKAGLVWYTYTVGFDTSDFLGSGEIHY